MALGASGIFFEIILINLPTRLFRLIDAVVIWFLRLLSLDDFALLKPLNFQVDPGRRTAPLHQATDGPVLVGLEDAAGASFADGDLQTLDRLCKGYLNKVRIQLRV